MNIPHDRRADVFTDWLDAQVTGTSTPDHELAADLDLADLCAAADQFHGLDQRLGQYATRVLPSTHTWEDIMSTNGNAIATSVGSHTPQSPSVSRQAAPYRAAAWDRFASGALTAAVVIALVAGAWRVSDWSPFGGGGSEPPTAISFGGFGPENDNQNERLAPVATVGADEQTSSFPYPTAAECTVEPPAREWVVDHLEQANVATREAVELYEWPIEPSSEDVDAIMSTFRMWQACQYNTVPYAYGWTLQTPWYTRTDTPYGIWREGPADAKQLALLTDLALAGTSDEADAIYSASQGTPDVSGTPDATPVPMDTPLGKPSATFAPIPEGATPIARSTTDSHSWPTIFADDIRIIGPNRAAATVYAVGNKTGTINPSSGAAGYIVELVLVDGVWLVDFYGEVDRG